MKYIKNFLRRILLVPCAIVIILLLILSFPLILLEKLIFDTPTECGTSGSYIMDFWTDYPVEWVACTW